MPKSLSPHNEMPAPMPLRKLAPWLLLALVWAAAITAGLFSPRQPKTPPPALGPAARQMSPTDVDTAFSTDAAATFLEARRAPATLPAPKPSDLPSTPPVPEPVPATGVDSAPTPSVQPPEPTATMRPSGAQGNTDLKAPSGPRTTDLKTSLAPKSPDLKTSPAPAPGPPSEPAAPPEPAAKPEPAPEPTTPAPKRDASKLLAEAATHLNAGRWLEADTTFSEALEQPGARSAAAYYGRAKARDGLGRTTDAETDLETALRIDARHPYALLLAGDIARKKGDRPGAIAFFKRYLEAWPQGRRASEIEAWLRNP